MKKSIEKILLLRLLNLDYKRNCHPRNVRPPYILKYIQALLNKEKKFKVELLDCLINNITYSMQLDYIIKFHPDLIVVNTVSTDLVYLMHFVRYIKNKLDTIVIGVGQNITDLVSNDLFDFFLCGESEIEACNIIEQINKGIDRIQIRDKLREKESFLVLDLDKLPFPSYTKSELKKYSFIYPIPLAKRLLWGHILTSRGCPYNCIFCSQITRDSFGTRFRARAPANIADEIMMQKSLGCNIISFDDDNFAASEEHVKGVCQELIKKNMQINWIVHARVDNLNYDLLRLMKRAGCILLRFGIESGAERIVRILNKTPKADWLDRSRQVFQYCKVLKISTVGLFMIGSPQETEEDIQESIKLAIELKPDIIQVSFFTPYPGSRIYDSIKNDIENRIDSLANLYHYRPSPVNVSNIKNEDLFFWHRIFYRKFLFRPKFVVQHIRKFLYFYLLNLDKFFRLSRPWRYLIFERRKRC